jgi:hypothetical protein
MFTFMFRMAASAFVFKFVKDLLGSGIPWMRVHLESAEGDAGANGLRREPLARGHALLHYFFPFELLRPGPARAAAADPIPEAAQERDGVGRRRSLL